MSVASGGVVPKTVLGCSDASGSFDDDGRGSPGGGGGGGGWGGRERLMVDDPLTGRDVSAGTYRCGPPRARRCRCTRVARAQPLDRVPARQAQAHGRPRPLPHRVDDLRIAFTRAARRLEALARAKRGPGAGDTNFLTGLFDVRAVLARSPRDLHGQAFPGADEGAGVKGLRDGAGRGGGRGGGLGGGRRRPPREVYVDEEVDLGGAGGDEMLLGEGGPQRGARGGGGGGGGGEDDDGGGAGRERP